MSRIHEIKHDDLMLPASEKIVMAVEGIGDNKFRLNTLSLDHPLVILADQAIEIVAIDEVIEAGRFDPHLVVANGFEHQGNLLGAWNERVYSH